MLVQWSFVLFLGFTPSPPLPSMTRTTRNSNRGLSPPPSAQCRRIKIDAREQIDDVAAPSTKRRKLISPSNNNMPPLLDLGKLLRGTLVKRPSAVIKSPYVADVSIHKMGSANTDSATTAATSTLLAHAPALDVGGMCVVGSEIYLSERGGEGKTSHSIELVRGAPLGGIFANSDDATNQNGGVLVGAHPRLGELIAEEVLKLGLLQQALPLKRGFTLGPVNDFCTTKKGSPKKSNPKKESPKKTNPEKLTADESQTAATDARIVDAVPNMKINLSQQVTLGDSRVDFQITLTNIHKDISHRVIFEVKNVVCADYESGTEPIDAGPGDCVIVAPSSSGMDGKRGYQRSALFPWGRTRGQKFDGRSVVSERACKHMKNLQSLIHEDVTPVVLFIVNRSDCESIRPCREKCPVFAEVLEEVVCSGVKALAVRVRWTEEGQCFYDGMIPVHV